MAANRQLYGIEKKPPRALRPKIAGRSISG